MTVRRAKRQSAAPSLDDSKVFRASGGATRTRAQVLRLAWSTGVVAPLILRKHQVALYQAIVETPRLKVRPIICSRRFGKTMTVLTAIEEQARQHPGSILRLSFPTIKQAQTVVYPNWRKVLATCPEDLRPEDRTANDEGGWVWPNMGPCRCGDPLCVTGPGPSILFLAGTDDADQRERLRGSDANWFFGDEAGSQKELKYTTKDVLGPQLDEVNGRGVLITTPPRSMAHDFTEFWDQGEASGLLFTRTIFDNTHLTPAKLRDICEERNQQEPGESKPTYDARIDAILVCRADWRAARKAGATSTWCREYLGGRVSDAEAAVCPEFDEALHVARCVRPAYVTRYVFIDQGHVVDFFAMIFCEYDFSTSKLRVLRELQFRHQNTRTIVQDAKKIEADLWAPQGDKHWESVPKSGSLAPKRYYDDPRGGQQVHDMSSDHKYYVMQAGKSPGDEENSRAVRYHVGAGHVEIDEVCRNLIAQCRDGVFRERASGKQEFERTKSFGHLDGFASLALGMRAVNWNHNPIPAGQAQAVPGQTFTVTPPKPKQESAAVKMIKSLFRGSYAR